MDVKSLPTSAHLLNNASSHSRVNQQKNDTGSADPSRPFCPMQSGAQSQMGSSFEDPTLPSSLKGRGIGIVFKNIKDEPFCMMHTVQQSVIFQNLDFSYITSRIAVMSYPAESFEFACGNDVNSVREFLDLRHPEHYAVYNVSGHAYSSVKFRTKVYEAGWPVEKAPPFKTLVWLCRNMYLYLRQDPKNICVVHCLDGKSSSAILVCAFLIFCKLFERPEDALQMFNMHRCPVNLTPSQLRYVQYVSDIVSNPPKLPHNNAVSLHSVCMRPIPLFNELRDGCRPLAEVYVGEECVFTSSQDYKTIRHYNLAEKCIVIPLTAAVAGDVTIIVYHAKSTCVENSHEKVHPFKMFQLQFYSGFISPSTQTIDFSRNELDGMKELDRYPDEFAVSVLLNPSCEKASDPSPLMRKVSQLKLNPKLLFDVDEDLEAFTSNFMNKENISETDGVVGNSAFVRRSNWNKGSENTAKGIYPESDTSVMQSPVKNLNEDFKNIPFCDEADLLNLRSSSPSPKANFLEDDLLLDADEDVSNHFDLLGNVQTLPESNTNSKFSHSINCDPVSRNISTGAVPEELCSQTRGPFFVLQNNKASDLGTSKDDSFVGTTSTSDHLKTNSGTQSMPSYASFLSSCKATFNVSSDKMGFQTPFSFNASTTGSVRDTAAAKKQNYPRYVATGGVSHHVSKSTPNLKALGKNKSDPFAFLRNISSSFGISSQEQSTDCRRTFQKSQPCAGVSTSAKEQQASQSTLPESTPQKSSYKRSYFGSVFTDRGAKKSGGIKPKLDGDEFEDLLESQGYGGFQRKVEEPKTIARLRHLGLAKQMDPEDLKILDWVDCKEHNIRALLCSLHTVLWEGTRWQEVGMHLLLSAADVKKYYRKACLAVHPDKQVGTTHEKLARLIFMQLKDAWNKFETQPNLT